MFVGDRATAGNSRDLIHDRGLRWTGPDFYPLAGGRQWTINSDAGCHHDDYQPTRGFRNKHHTRIFELAASQYGNRVSLQDAHYDEKRKSCKGLDTVPLEVQLHHRVYTGYDFSQREFLDAYSDRRRGRQLGPRRTKFVQCDVKSGRSIMVPWNGIVQFFTVNADYP